MSIELYNRHGKRVSRARGLAALESITRCFPSGFVADGEWVRSHDRLYLFDLVYAPADWLDAMGVTGKPVASALMFLPTGSVLRQPGSSPLPPGRLGHGKENERRPRSYLEPGSNRSPFANDAVRPAKEGFECADSTPVKFEDSPGPGRHVRLPTNLQPLEGRGRG